MEMITITKALYDSLQEDSLWLNCLESAGVDNWDGLEYAIEIKDQMLEKQNDTL